VSTFRRQLKHSHFSHYERIRGFFTVNVPNKLLTYLPTYLQLNFTKSSCDKCAVSVLNS